MMIKRGTSLIESVIAIFLVSVVIVTILTALDVGTMGTLYSTRRISALNLAKSQLEYVKSQRYIAATGSSVYNLSEVYGLITVNTSGISDKTNYVVDGYVEYVGTNSSLQKITINVSYLPGKKVQLIGYKSTNQMNTKTSTYTYGNYTYSSGGGTNKWAYEKVNGWKSWDWPSHPTSPTDGTLIEATSTNYAQISSLDTARWRTHQASLAEEYDEQLFKFKINESEATISNIEVKWTGYGSTGGSTYTVNLSIWDSTLNKWEQLHIPTPLTSEATWTKSLSSNCGNYSDSSGYLYVVLLCKHSGGLGEPGCHTNSLEVSITQLK